MKPTPLNCTYKHTKSGKIYYAFGLCENKTTGSGDGQVMVLYRRESESRSEVDGTPQPPDQKVFAREVEEFLAKFERV